jgi:NAD(P)-dependent dehydrogenase (short-subunit alcohol dehydrogenase family)
MSILEQFKLTKRVALVTGGAGLYGRQIVRALAEAGARVCMASRNVEKLRQFADELGREGMNVTAHSLDQGSESSIKKLLETVCKQEGGVDVLVNNAVERPAKNWSASAADFAKSMAVNATGLFLMTREFGNHMAERNRGSIINIGSIQGMVGPDFTLYEGLNTSTPPDYFFHKGGLLQLTRYAASKLGSRNVRVNAISPGGYQYDQDPTFVERYNARTFLGRMGNDSDLAGAVVFLASDASAYITGVNIPVDGGYTAK